MIVLKNALQIVTHEKVFTFFAENDEVRKKIVKEFNHQIEHQMKSQYMIGKNQSVKEAKLSPGWRRVKLN